MATLDNQRQKKWEMERHAGLERAQQRAARAKAKRRERGKLRSRTSQG